MNTHPTLKNILVQKKESPHAAHEVVETTTSWLCDELNGAAIEYNRFDCGADFYAYSRITLRRNLHGIDVALEIKIAEINKTPRAFADVRLISQYYRPMLPFSCDLTNSDEKEKLLHYVADFVLGVQSGEIEKNPRFAEAFALQYNPSSVV